MIKLDTTLLAVERQFPEFSGVGKGQKSQLCEGLRVGKGKPKHKRSIIINYVSLRVRTVINCLLKLMSLMTRLW